MFAFGQQEAPAKTAASKKKPQGRVSLAGRSLSSHRNNDENAVPAPSTPRGHASRGSTFGKGAPLPAQQAFLQVQVEKQTLVVAGMLSGNGCRLGFLCRVGLWIQIYVPLYTSTPAVSYTR